MFPWTITQSHPVIAPGTLHPAFDSARAGAAHVIEIDGAFRMVYWGTDSDRQHHLLQAEASIGDPQCWRLLGGPLLGPQPDSVWNQDGPSFPHLLPVTESHWLLYFTAWGRRDDGRLPNTTGVAVSEDAGATWHYHREHPIIAADRSFDAEGSGSVWVLLEGDLFRMYYTAIGPYRPAPPGVKTRHGAMLPTIGIGYAESRDGIRWHKPIDHLVVAPRGFDVMPYEYICSKPCVLRTADGYMMWVNTYGTAYRVHRLTSADGLRWQWTDRLGPDGELGTGSPGAFDDTQRSYPCVVSRGDTLHNWYTGNDFGCTGMGHATSSLGLLCTGTEHEAMDASGR